MRRGLALAALVVLAGCASAPTVHMPDDLGAPPTTAQTTTTIEADIGTAQTIAPAYCRAYAPRLEEDEAPPDHDGAPLVDFDSMDDIGCATYADGWAYDGLGWVSPVLWEQG